MALFLTRQFNIVIVITSTLLPRHTVSSSFCGGNTPKYIQINLYGIETCKHCRKCPPGSYVSRVCEGYDDTECAQCDDGSYSTGWSRLEECKPCTRCPAHLSTTRNCTKTQNAKCGKVCDHGYFSDILSGGCFPCSWCFPSDKQQAPPRIQECIEQGMPPNFQCMPSRVSDGVPTFIGYVEDVYNNKESEVLHSVLSNTVNTDAYSDDPTLPNEFSNLLSKPSHRHFSVPTVIVSGVLIFILIVMAGVFLFRQSRVCAFHKRGYVSLDDAAYDYSASRQDVRINVRVNPLEDVEGSH
ncbi:uncharacterized protein LOC144356231 [Saccoglossus kowalevskii]